MAQPKQGNSQAVAILDHAMQTEKGIKIKFNLWRLAWNFRMSCYNAVKRDRKLSRELFPSTDPAYDTSMYDELEIELIPKKKTIPDEGASLFFKRRETTAEIVKKFNIELL